MPRLHHSSDCSTVSTICTDNDLGSRVYIGIYHFSCYLLPTELEGDIGITMSAYCPLHLWIFCAFADKLMIMGLHRPDKLLVALCPSPAISWPLIGRSFLSGVLDYFDRNKILSGYDLSHYQVPHCIRVFFYFVWFVFIHHNFQFYFELCTYCNILDIYLS